MGHSSKHWTLVNIPPSLQPYTDHAILQTTKLQREEMSQPVSGFTDMEQIYEGSFPICIADFKNPWKVYCISAKIPPFQAP